MMDSAAGFAAELAAEIVHLALMLAAAPVLVGYIRWLKARLLGRKGPPPLQPWHDLLRLLRKRSVLAFNASPLFRAAPALGFAATLAAAALVPSFALDMATAPVADLLMLAGLLALARCILALAALDVGTAFGGIGASREMMFPAFAEPGLILAIFALALLAGTTNLDAISTLLRDGAFGLHLSLGLILLATLAIALAANGRLPVDGSGTHPEMATAQAATTLEYGGSDLALVEMTAALKLLLWFCLIAAVFLPFGLAPAKSLLAWPLGLLGWTLKMTALATALAVFETGIAGMRLFRVPQFLGAAVLLGILAAVLLFVGTGIPTWGG